MMGIFADPKAFLHPRQQDAFTSKANEILFGGSAGGGKALALDTPIPTPQGWTTMGDLRPGDKVFDESGKPCSVLACTEVMENRPCYRVLFSDGSEIVADAQHEWLTMTDTERKRAYCLTPEFRESRRAARPKRGTGKKPWLAELNAAREHQYLEPPIGVLRTTKSISETLTVREGKRTNHSVIVAGALTLPDADLPIDPYVLGVWLGDGTSVSGEITNADKELLLEIENAGYELSIRKNKLRYGVLGLQSQLRSCGLLNNKHIPACYLRSSLEQRMALIQGLMDTDGGIDGKSGKCEFTNCNRVLAEQMAELLISIGIKVRITEGRVVLQGKDCGPKYRLIFTTTRPVFRLPRKLKLLPKSISPITGRRMIVSCEPVASVPVRCIQVDSPSHLYLAGKTMIPTHNSLLLRYLAVWCALTCPGLQVYLFRRIYPDLQKNHMEGATGLPVMLAEMVESKAVTINYGKGVINFWNGSRIFLCHCQHEKNVYNYQGAEIHLLLIDELTHFSERIYRFLRGRCRLGAWRPPRGFGSIFPRIVCGSNPGGVGHFWCKEMFVTPKPPNKVWRTPKSEGSMLRQFIPSLLKDNPTMEQNDPDYRDRLLGLGDPALVKAMLEGNWDIVAGGALDDVWNTETQIIDPFPIPENWHIDRSFDWGSSAPFSVGWWAVANGEEVRLKDGTTRCFPPGSLIRIGEWYGWNGRPNEGCKMLAEHVARGILERERTMGLKNVRPGPADSAIFTTDNGHCIADDMKRHGVTWTPCQKGTGSRVNGLEKVRAMLKASSSTTPEFPGLYAFSRCIHYIRTMPVLPRSQLNPEDVDTNAEDHVYDEVRYRVTTPTIKMTVMEV